MICSSAHPVPVPVFRFAPSPNGYLHLGHAYSALLNEAAARAVGGTVLLRIEDIDIVRCRPEFETALREDLAWLGLTYPEPVRRQSDHMPFYADALGRLRARDLVYPCFCSRAEIRRAVAGQGGSVPRDPDGAPLYPGTCLALAPEDVGRKLAAGDLHTWRLRLPAALAIVRQPLTMRTFDVTGCEECRPVDPAAWGDVVLGRREVPTSYHLSVVLDDALQNVSHVVRGADLLASTAIHRLLQELFALPAPRYHHHALINDDAGRKLAKSEGALPLRALRDRGVSAAAARRMLGVDARLGVDVPPPR